MGSGLDITFMLEVLPKLLKGALLTLELSILCVILSSLAGLLLGTARVLGPRWLQRLVQAYVDVIRGVPPITIIALAYFGLPEVGLTLNEYWTGVLALTLVGGGYAVEILRAAVESLGKGQSEAAAALGLSRLQTYWDVLLPQSLRLVLPPLTNELANLIKASSLLSVISVNELAKTGNDLIFQHFVVIEVLVQVTLLYLLIIGSLDVLSRWLETSRLVDPERYRVS
ncbi:MAG: amino acid ABC transporter permease [Geminicoccales bacterium]